jgi:hypothetical protein
MAERRVKWKAAVPPRDPPLSPPIGWYIGRADFLDPILALKFRSVPDFLCLTFVSKGSKEICERLVAGPSPSPPAVGAPLAVVLVAAVAAVLAAYEEMVCQIARPQCKRKAEIKR